MAEDKKKITFRGKQVTLKYPLLALQRLETVGVSLADMEDMSDDLSITLLGQLVWAGLSCEFNDATVDEVLEAFEISDLKDLSEALSSAFSGMGK